MRNYWQNSASVAGYGLLPMRKLLLVGAPGTGKAATAEAVAAELHLPLLHLRLDSLVTRFMDHSSSRLRLILDAMQTVRGVYFFDQVNEVAELTSRADLGDTARVRNCLAQFVEREHPQSVIIAAVAPTSQVDHALFRYFDQVLEYPLPAGDIVQQLIQANIANLLPPDFAWSRVTTAALGLSHAEIGVASRQAAKDAILSDQRYVTADRLIAALKERNL
ncbi:MAG: AAA family ATPase [Actinomycetes bacterium]